MKRMRMKMRTKIKRSCCAVGRGEEKGVGVLVVRTVGSNGMRLTHSCFRRGNARAQRGAHVLRMG